MKCNKFIFSVNREFFFPLLFLISCSKPVNNIEHRPDTLAINSNNKISFVASSYNLRFDTPKDFPNHRWIDRCPLIAFIIEKYNFDVFGTQEGLLNQLNDLKDSLKVFDYIGEGRQGGNNGEFAAIFYNKNKFEVLDQGSFFLNEHPDSPGAGWDAALPRVAMWGRFKIKNSNLQFYFFNTHLDHKGVKARLQSVKLIMNQIIEKAKGIPVILTGDFNVSQYTNVYQEVVKSKLLFDSHEKAVRVGLETFTFNGFGKAIESDKRIDFVFVSKEFEVKESLIITDKPEGKFPSDHYPVSAIMEIN